MSDSTSPSGIERRRHPRANCDWPITITLDDGVHQAKLRDVSRGGLCFFLDRRIPEMTILRMSLDLPDRGTGTAAKLEGSGVVVRCQPISAGVEHYEIAVFLNDLTDTNRERLDAYVAASA